MQALELTSREKVQLLKVLREIQKAKGEEQRGEKRRKVLLNLWIRKIGKGGDGVSMFQGRVVNVSANGVALVAKRSAASGDKLVLPLRFKEGGGWLVLCEVRNCKKAEGGLYRVGARFVDRVEDPDGDARVPMDWVV